MATLRRDRSERRARRQRGLKIQADLRQAEKLITKFGLQPETRTVDAGRSSAVQDILNRRKVEADRALQRDPEQASLLETLKSGLGGLTSVENTMMRERAEQGMDTGLSTNLRALAGLQGRSGVRGAAAQAGALDLMAERMLQGRNLERDIQLENINVQDRRRQGYGDFLSDLTNNEFNRRQSTINSLEGSTGIAETGELNRQLFNIGQEDKADALRGSTLFGLVGLRGGRRNTRDALALEKERLELERANAEKMYQAMMAQAEAYSKLM